MYLWHVILNYLDFITLFICTRSFTLNRVFFIRVGPTSRYIYGNRGRP
jgi:hypothetical protein